MIGKTYVRVSTITSIVTVDISTELKRKTFAIGLLAVHPRNVIRVMFVSPMTLRASMLQYSTRDLSRQGHTFP